MPQTGPASQSSVAFLLTQLGSHAAARFAERVAELELSPPQVGMLGMIGSEPGMSQQALADRLGLLPSKVVSFIDDFETRDLVTRTRGTADRRVYELTLTEQGRRALEAARDIAGGHESAFFEALSTEEYGRLRALLRRLADSHGLPPGIHPGYRHLR